jgi:ribulose-phosphate 3-epimerase
MLHPSILAPSLLAGDHARLAESAAAAGRLGIPWLHLDIMDGHFVPNLSFGPETLASLRRDGVNVFFDTHLMLDEPQKFVEAFVHAGADRISIHIEPSYDVVGTLAQIKELGRHAGLVLKPGTPASAVEALLAQVDLVLVMTVEPGFGGQAFRADMLPKIAQIAAWRRDRNLSFRIEVDGGIDLATAAECRAEGADTFVVGTAFFKSEDQAGFAKAIAAL